MALQPPAAAAGFHGRVHTLTKGYVLSQPLSPLATVSPCIFCSIRSRSRPLMMPPGGSPPPAPLNPSEPSPSPPSAPTDERCGRGPASSPCCSSSSCASAPSGPPANSCHAGVACEHHSRVKLYKEGGKKYTLRSLKRPSWQLHGPSHLAPLLLPELRERALAPPHTPAMPGAACRQQRR